MLEQMTSSKQPMNPFLGTLSTTVTEAERQALPSEMPENGFASVLSELTSSGTDSSLDVLEGETRPLSLLAAEVMASTGGDELVLNQLAATDLSLASIDTEELTLPISGEASLMSTALSLEDVAEAQATAETIPSVLLNQTPDKAAEQSFNPDLVNFTTVDGESVALGEGATPAELVEDVLLNPQAEVVQETSATRVVAVSDELLQQGVSSLEESPILQGADLTFLPHQPIDSAAYLATQADGETAKSIKVGGVGSTINGQASVMQQQANNVTVQQQATTVPQQQVMNDSSSGFKEGVTVTRIDATPAKTDKVDATFISTTTTSTTSQTSTQTNSGNFSGQQNGQNQSQLNQVAQMQTQQQNQMALDQQARVKFTDELASAKLTDTLSGSEKDRVNALLGDLGTGDRRTNLPNGFGSIHTPVRHPQWGQAFGQRVVFMANSQMQEAKIALNPEKLGPVQIKLHVDKDQQVHVSMHALHGQTREAMENALPRLREMLEQAGINFGSLDVSDQPEFNQSEQDEQSEGGSANAALASEDETEEKTTNLQLKTDNIVDYYA